MNISEIVKLKIRQEILKSINHFGIEGTEDAIRLNYKLMPVIKHRFLAEYYALLAEQTNGGNNDYKKM